MEGRFRLSETHGPQMHRQRLPTLLPLQQIRRSAFQAPGVGSAWASMPAEAK